MNIIQGRALITEYDALGTNGVEIRYKNNINWIMISLSNAKRSK